jgi:quinol monooxygenase YgiN
MKTNLNKQWPLLATCLSLVFLSCNSDDPQKQEAAKTTDTVQVSAPAVFKPFDVVEINHTVKDYAIWRKAFDADSPARKASGMELIALGRNIDNPNNISIALSVADMDKAKAFSSDPRLKDVMEKNGVVSKPSFSYYHVLRMNPDSKEKTWLLVTHKVKDFDAWLKVFDAEGSASRAAQGLIDVVLSRDKSDSNIVHIVFDIKDMAKAKAEMASEEKKKLMMSAGVVGEPKFEFYTSGE